MSKAAANLPQISMMSVFMLSGQNERCPRRMMLPLVSHSEYADGTDRQTDKQTDGRQTVTLRFPLDAVGIMIITHARLWSLGSTKRYDAYARFTSGSSCSVLLWDFKALQCHRIRGFAFMRYINPRLTLTLIDCQCGEVCKFFQYLNTV